MSPKAAKKAVVPSSDVNNNDEDLRLLARRHRGLTMLKMTYRVSIYKILKKVHPDTEISLKAMTFMNTLVNDVLDRIAKEARLLPMRRMTITANEIQVAVRMLFTGELGKQAVRAGRNAVTKYVSSDPRICEHGTNDDEQ